MVCLIWTLKDNMHAFPFEKNVRIIIVMYINTKSTFRTAFIIPVLLFILPDTTNQD